MEDSIKKFIEDLFDITIIDRYSFRRLYGLTFVFKKQAFFMNDRLSSAEIKPVAIIYEENDEYYLAPLDVTDEIEVIVKEYVKNFL